MNLWTRLSNRTAILFFLAWLGERAPASAASQVVAWGDLGPDMVPAGLTDAVAIAGGQYHNLALRANGTVVAWGDDGLGQTRVPAGLANTVAIAAGGNHSLALLADARVAAWGDNALGQTSVPAGLTNAAGIAAGGYHSLAVTEREAVAAWGDNTYGQTTVPPALTNAVAVAAGFYHSLALRANGTVVAWGDNSFGQATVPAGLMNVTAIAAGGDHSLALRADGEVVAWGDNTFGQVSVPADLTNVVAVAAGDYHSLALRADGTAVAWGLRYNGATAVPIGLTNVLAVAAGGSHSLVLVQDSPPFLTRPVVNRIAVAGSTASLSAGVPVLAPLTFQWSFNGTTLPGATNAVLTLTDLQTNQTGSYWLVVSNAFGIVAGSETALTVLPLWVTAPPRAQTNVPGQTVTFSVLAQSAAPLTYQWRFNGTNLLGATNSTLTLANVQPDQGGPYSVTLSNVYGVATTPDANLSVIVVVQWTVHGQYLQQTNLANLGNVVALAQSSRGFGLALKADGTVFSWGGAPQMPGNLTDIVAVAAGWEHCLALRADGTVTAWGNNPYGQTNVPAGLSNIVAITAGEFHNLALRADGTVAAWGDDSAGQTNVPAFLTNVVAIAAGGFHSLALNANGRVTAWGDVGSSPSSSSVPAPAGLTNVVGVASGISSSLALKTDGSVVAWGRQTNVPADLSNAVAIAAGRDYSLALKTDGTLVAWGSQTNVPPGLSNVVAIAAEGSVGLFGIYCLALLGSGPPVLNATASSPDWTANGFSLSVLTRSGRVYELDYKDSLSDSHWTALPLVAGNGHLRTLTDPTATGAQRFYRVRQW